MEVDDGSDQKSDILPHWMAAHARLEKELTEDEKYNNLMRWLIFEMTHRKETHLYSFHIAEMKIGMIYYSWKSYLRA